MKLWVKSVAGLAGVGIASGAILGGIALFNVKSDKVKGASFSSSSPMDTHFPESFKGKSIQDLQPSDLTAYFTKMNAQLDDKFADYTYNPQVDPNGIDNGEVFVQGKTTSFETFYKSYIKQYNDTPELVVKFGPAVFQNEYLDAVSAKEFLEYVVWFLKNVAWGGDLAALEHFSLKRGVKTAGSSIILGEHVNTNSEKTTIEFYPDAFFGSLPMYSQENGQGQKIDNLLMKLSDLNGTLLTIDDVKQLVENKKTIESNSAVQSFTIRSIEAVKNIVRNGKEQMGYEVYADIYPGLIDDVLNRFPYLTKPLEGPHVVADTDAGIQSTVNGDLYWNYKLLENGSYRGIDTNSRIPFLAILKAANPNFKGVGINWLKYVGQHEYGHHTTLSDEQDASENAVYAGASSSQKAINQGKLYSVDALNKYLQARSRTLSIANSNQQTGTSDLTEIVKFIENGVPEPEADAYGSVDPNDTSAAILNDRRRAMHITTDELATAALNRNNGASLYDLMIENAWDGYSATINPGFEADALYYKYSWEKDATTGKYVPTRAQLTPGGIIQRDNGNLNSNPGAINAYNPNDPTIKNQLFLKDASGTPIETDMDILDKTTNQISKGTWQFIIQRWDDSVKTPVRYVANSGNYGTYYSIKPYDGPDDGKEKTIQDPNDPTKTIVVKKPNPPTTRTTVIQTRTSDGTLAPIVPANASGTDLAGAEQQIMTFLSSIVSTYEMNGWDKSSTLISGANILSRIYYQGELQQDGSAAQSTADKIDKSAATWVNNRDYYLEGVANNSLPTNATLQDMSTMWKAADSVATQLANFGQAIFTATTQGIGFGAYNGMGAFYNIDGKFITSMPTGDFSPWGPTSSGRGDATWNQFSRDLTPTDKAKLGNFEFINQANPTWYLGTTYNTTDQKYYYYWYDPAKDGAALDSSQKPLNTITPSDLTKPENASVMYFNGLNIMSAYTITTQTAEQFKAYNFKDDMFSAQLMGWKKPASLTTATDNQMRLSNYYDIFTADPFTDFEYSKKTNGTVYTNAFLSKIFDLTKVKAANPTASPEDVQLFLTAVLNAQTLVTLKDDLKNIDDFKVTENSSLWALLTQGKDENAANNALFSKGVGLRSVLSNYPTTSDLASIVDAMKAKKIAWLTNKDFGANMKMSSDKLSFSEFALLAGLWHFNDSPQSQPNPSIDLFYQLNVAPSPDVVDYLVRRNQDTLDDIFSDYTYNVPEMTNRDYLQMTYMPNNTTPLPGTPDWLGEVTEARSGWEYYIDASATKKYLDASLMTVRSDQSTGQQVNDFKKLTDGIAKTFHFTIDDIGDVQMDIDPNTGEKYPMVSDGIKAVANANNWTNYVSPSFLGKTLSESNGFFKDDFLRRGAGKDVYEVDQASGAETGKFLGSWIDEKFYPIEDWNKSRSKLSTTPTRQLENMLIADSNGNILARKATDKTAWNIEKGSAWDGYLIDIEHPFSAVDTFYDPSQPSITVPNNAYPVKDSSGKIVAAICVENNHVYQVTSQADLNPDASKRTTIAYVVGSAFNESVDNKIIVEGSKVFGRMGSSTIYNWSKDQINVDGTFDQSKFIKLQALHGAEMYGLDGKPVQDQTIRIRDLQGNPVTDRARAVWMWLLEQKGITNYADQNGNALTPQEWKAAGGVGTGRNMDGLWRSPVRDASYLWGYLPKEFIAQNVDGSSANVTRHASDISYIEFKDTQTGSTKYLPVAIGENNLFYFNDRGVVNADGSQGAKTTLDDEGYTSWTSDFATIGSYYDGLLLSGHNYVMSFVGANKEFITKVDLGTRTIICENGKPEGKAPNYIKQNEKGETVIYVNDQFNS